MEGILLDARGGTGFDLRPISRGNMGGGLASVDPVPDRGKPVFVGGGLPPKPWAMMSPVSHARNRGQCMVDVTGGSSPWK